MSGTSAPASKLPGAWRMFTALGVNVHLHWAWGLIALVELQSRADAYSSPFFNVLEYLGLFGIVLLHEFGHALACKSVGGTAKDIMLWPLGGIAYVRPPQRPGATLWAIAAGPLVNVVLLPLTIVPAVVLVSMNAESDVSQLVFALAVMNAIVLVFNILPIYPLDGGQMLRSVLWYFIGPHRSLNAATIVGLVGAVAGLIFALYLQDIWLIVFAFFGATSSLRGLKVARNRLALASLPRRGGLACPECDEPPPAGDRWACDGCKALFDIFASAATCPSCDHAHPQAVCGYCGSAHAFGSFARPAPATEPTG